MKINCDKDPDTAATFNVRSLPTVLFVTPNGQRVSKISRYLPPAAFADKLRDVIRTHRGFAAIEAKFKADPTDTEAGARLGAAYAGSGQASMARKVIKRLEAVDPDNESGHLTEAYLAMGEHYLDVEERPTSAIRWYTKAVQRGRKPSAVAVARYRIGMAYFLGRTKHATRARRFGKKLRSARAAIDDLMAMNDVPEDLRLQADDLAQQIREELAEHEKQKKGR